MKIRYRNFDNPPDLMLMQQFDNGQGPDIETVTPFFEVQGTSTCERVVGPGASKPGLPASTKTTLPHHRAHRERTVWDRRWKTGSGGPDRTALCDWRRG
jgi:hypothetical protein